MGGVAELRDEVDSVADDDVVYRRFGWKLATVDVEDVDIGEHCPLGSNHFGDFSESMAREKGYPGPCMSVGLRSALVAHGFDAHKLLDGWIDYGVASIQVGDLRKLTKQSGDPCPQGVMLCPEDGEPWHAVVFDVMSAKRSAAAKKALLSVARIEIPLIRHI